MELFSGSFECFKLYSQLFLLVVPGLSFIYNVPLSYKVMSLGADSGKLLRLPLHIKETNLKPHELINPLVKVPFISQNISRLAVLSVFDYGALFQNKMLIPQVNSLRNIIEPTYAFYRHNFQDLNYLFKNQWEPSSKILNTAWPFVVDSIGRNTEEMRTLVQDIFPGVSENERSQIISSLLLENCLQNGRILHLLEPNGCKVWEYANSDESQRRSLKRMFSSRLKISLLNTLEVAAHNVSGGLAAAQQNGLVVHQVIGTPWDFAFLTPTGEKIQCEVKTPTHYLTKDTLRLFCRNFDAFESYLKKNPGERGYKVLGLDYGYKASPELVAEIDKANKAAEEAKKPFRIVIS